MKRYTLIIASKNINSLNTFLIFFKKFCTLNFAYFDKKFVKKKKKVFTILKSPHVNKKAQEQFGIIFFYVQITLNITKEFKFLIFLKILKMNLFPDISIKFKTFIYKKKKSLLLKMFTPCNYRNFSYIKNKNENFLYFENLSNKFKLNPKNEKFIKICDFYGNLLKKMFG